MAEWVNIFDLGAWDVYVRYKGVSGAVTPDSVSHFVKASELDPAVGTVTVNAEGQIVCTLEDQSGGGGANQPTIVVMPVSAIAGAAARLTCSAVTGLSSASSSFGDVASVAAAGAGIYDVTAGAQSVAYADSAAWQNTTQLPSPIATGAGLTFTSAGPGV